MKKLLLLTGATLSLMSSCTTDDSNTPQPSLVGRWQLDNYSIRSFRNGQTTSQSVVTRDSLSSCLLDDYTTYNADQTGTEFYGQPCSGQVRTQEPFTWEMNGNQLIRTYGSGQSDGMTIAVMTEGYYTALDTLPPAANRTDSAVLMQQYKRIQ